MKKVKSLPSALRPREKLLKNGAESLALSELIAVLLTTGTKSKSVLLLSSQVAKIIDEKRKTEFTDSKSRLSYEDLRELGLGPHKISQILSAVEIGKRLSQKNSLKLTDPGVVYANSQEIISSDKESLLCFYLNARGELMKKEIVAVGALNKLSVLPREIFSLMREYPVAQIIMVHNHPSGNLDPSNDDIAFTKRVKKAGDILGVVLLDHLIVAKTGWRRIKY